jgi:hypothetical protein
MRDAVIDSITRLFVATDNRDWNGVKRLFADKVEFDMTSLAGGQPVTMTPQQIADGWEQGLKPIQSVHHQAGNFLVTFSGSEADASCYGIAYHYRPAKSGRNTRVFVGTYDFHLRLHGDDWKIEMFRFNLRFIDGNPNLESD